jgi:polyphosphate kinase
VRSIVGRFLEHSRMFYFENGGNPEIYLGSADWMPRNLYDRVEVLFPLKDPHICNRIIEILSAYLADTRKARVLSADGTYSRPRSVRNGHGFSVQEHLMRVASNTNGDAPRIPALSSPLLAYTVNEVKRDPVNPSEDSDTQESTNAAV